MRRTTGGVSGTMLRATALVVLAVVTLGASRFWERESEATASAVDLATVTGREARLNPLTPRDPDRLPASEAAAIVRLASVASAATPNHGAGHSHAPTAEVALDAADAARFEAQFGAARDAALALATVEAAQAAGYRAAAVPGVGVGTHYMKWSLVDAPFDPAQPSMLLFDERPGRARQIVGLSYLVRSDTEPEGFAGPNDHWHQHAGLCVVNGWLDKENSPKSSCLGTWFAGADLWMLHAWVVPGWENRDGVFANLNTKLCPPEAGTPDISRCSFFTGTGPSAG